MLIDTHCHINMMVKKEFDVPLSHSAIEHAHEIVDAATRDGVTRIINVGTNLIESKNCLELAQRYDAIYAAVGLHPNDSTANWRAEVDALATLAKNHERHKIVAVGECGLDRHYPDYNIQRQKDVFKAQIELALEHDLALIVHTRDAAEETLRSLEEFAGDIKRCVIHCFSEDQPFADQVITWGFMIGIGGTITYPKNNGLRSVVTNVALGNIVLETDAPFLPVQEMRGKQNHPKFIKTIAEYVAELRQETFEHVAEVTTANAMRLFDLK